METLKGKANQIISNTEYLNEVIDKMIAENKTLKDMLETLKKENRYLLECMAVRNNES